MDNLNKKWLEFCNLPFPDDAGLEEIKGVDLLLLDSSSAGCIDTYISDTVISNNECLDILNDAVNSLRIVLPILEGSTREYFEALLSIILDILKKAVH